MENRSEIFFKSTMPKRGKEVDFDKIEVLHSDKIEVLQSDDEKGTSQVGDQGKLAKIRFWLNKWKHVDNIIFMFLFITLVLVLSLVFILGSQMYSENYRHN